MAKKKSSPAAVEPNRDATPTSEALVDAITRSEPVLPGELTADALASDPELDAEQTVSNAIALIARAYSDPNFRVIRQKVKVGGVWYHVEVSRP